MAALQLQAESDANVTEPFSGELDMLTYNVAGLPQGVSRSDPLLNTLIMSPLLNRYPYVFVQEDFEYHDELVADTGH